MPTYSRLLHLGNAVADVVLPVDQLPERGDDCFVTGATVAAGGGFNVMAAAARQGLAVAYGGELGTGPFADVVARALRAEGIVVLHEPAPTDTGFVVTIVDGDGERTFLTSPGAEATLTSAQLAAVRPEPGDVVYLTGYSFVHPSNREALLDFLPSAPEATDVLFDPGPALGSIPPAALAAVLDRATWVSCNAREALLLTGHADPLASAAALSARVAEGGHGRGDRGGVVVRDGARGCVVALPGTPPSELPGYAIAAVDTNGAGDTHVGVFVAALAQGADPYAAAELANAAAALAVTARGPATAPTRAELEQFLSPSRPPSG